MSQSSTCGEGSSVDNAADTDHSTLKHLIEHAAHVLPSQGAITAFVHHNTLHAFEDLPFDVAVRLGAEVFGCRPYLPEERFREEVTRGRIRPQDLEAVLIDDLGEEADELIGSLGTRFHLRMAMLEHPLQTGSLHELRWAVEETDALRKFREETPLVLRSEIIAATKQWVMRELTNGRQGHGTSDQSHPGSDPVTRVFELFGQSNVEKWDDAIWEAFTLHLLWWICRDGVEGVEPENPERHLPVRPRDLLLDVTGEDADRPVHELLIRFCAAFLDQGFADWPLPNREAGLYHAFIEVDRHAGGPPDRWMRGLGKELQRLHLQQVSALESIQESLDLFGVDEDSREEFITQTLLALRGFAGMIWQMETRGDRVEHPAPQGSLIDFLAIRLILDRFSAAYFARRVGFRGPLCELSSTLGQRLHRSSHAEVETRAYLVFQLAQVRGWEPHQLHELSQSVWRKLIREIESFSSLQRRRVYQLAYERKYNVSLLDAVAVHSQRTREPDDTPAFQVVCCIDDREESYRRHLEEIAQDCETFGFAGFFAVAMYYRGAADAYYLPLCPVVIKPSHYVCEEVAYSFEGTHRRRTEVRRALGTASHHLHQGSRTFWGGILTGVLGAVASIPLVARVLAPRTTSEMVKLFGGFVRTPPITQLTLERVEPDPGPDEGHLGYSINEMAGIVERVLRDIGLTSNFARLVIFTGHGSSSLNNPHESAYNCGACAGGRGGPNARAFAQMANDPRIRRLLADRGLPIPETTVFVGTYHNTCDDSVMYFDLDRLPTSHRHDFDRAKTCIDQARQRNAHERCRRFESAKLSLTPPQALKHVEGRSVDLSQARPEYNHATNAVTIVGRRWRFRGLFLDRRAFLASYDPVQDDANSTILERILQPAVPVCAGISLEYYFSCVDPEGWGCGSKLPHNVTSLLGVMSGAASDLRPGLSQQMIEIHEPIRQVFLIESTPDAMLRIMEDNEDIRKLCVNNWVYLATLDPHSSQIHVFRSGRFEPYVPQTHELPFVGSSQDWYRGWRENLGFASIKTGSSGVVTTGRFAQQGGA
ncbi:MAG: DUF2309 domain-containing protein [Planctomycetaceae bacterium]